eukprot:TRINITY_DN9448_c0_g1_i1.p1 TRINITY_DN9448_c0_g1~~TRINITY_DN9448_c0_g1_i1.p1  ORF type:complete len:268 (+),score=42.98 TRINITY_DN9448_c0_g1_i1:82-804(+)
MVVSVQLRRLPCAAAAAVGRVFRSGRASSRPAELGCAPLLLICRRCCGSKAAPAAGAAAARTLAAARAARTPPPAPKYNGVYWESNRRYWVWRLRYRGATLASGKAPTAEEAARARDAAFLLTKPPREECLRLLNFGWEDYHFNQRTWQDASSNPNYESCFIGVVRKGKRWVARMPDGKMYPATDELSAAKEYDTRVLRAAESAGKPVPRTNFPRTDYLRRPPQPAAAAAAAGTGSAAER